MKNEFPAVETTRSSQTGYTKTKRYKDGYNILSQNAGENVSCKFIGFLQVMHCCSRIYFLDQPTMCTSISIDPTFSANKYTVVVNNTPFRPNYSF